MVIKYIKSFEEFVNENCEFSLINKRDSISPSSTLILEESAIARYYREHPEKLKNFADLTVK